MKRSGIDDLLQAHRVGTVETDREFTLDSLRARKKLAGSQLAPGLWLVKLVQAAVVSKASRIEVRFGQRQVEFRADGGEWQDDPKQVTSTLLSGELPREPFLFHLLAGLRGSIFEDTVDAVWTMADRHSVFEVRFSSDGTRVSQEAREEPGESWFRLRTSRPLRWPHSKDIFHMPLKQLLQRTADEYLALHKYCWSCPVPLKVDGRPLECRYRYSPAPDETSVIKLSQQLAITSPNVPKPTVLLRREMKRPPDRPMMELNWPRGVGAHENFLHDEVLAERKKEILLEDTWIRIPLREGTPPGGYLLLLFGHQVDSEIEFYCDGARVDCLVLPWKSGRSKVGGIEIPQNAYKIGLRVLLPVTTEELDLSHFKVRNKEKILEQSFPDLKQLVRDSAELCAEQGKNFKYVMAPRPDSAAGKVGSALLGAVMRVHLPLRLAGKMVFKSELKSLLKSLDEEEPQAVSAD